MRDIFRAPNFRLPEAVGLVFGVDHLNSSIIFSGKKKKITFVWNVTLIYQKSYLLLSPAKL